MEFEELVRKISIFNNDNPHSNLVIKNNLPISEKDYLGNQYELQQHNWKIGFYKYKKEMRDAKNNIKKKSTEELDNIDSILDKLQKNEFSKIWHKMNLKSQLLKLDEYLDKLYENDEINFEKKKILKKNLTIKLHNKLLKSSDVKYDNVKCRIIEIKNI